MDRYEFPPELEYLGHERDMRGLGYRAIRTYAWTWFQPRLERFTYKYRALIAGDSTSLDRLRDIVVRSRFHLSKVTDFNDPFDSTGYFFADGDVKERRARLDQLVRDNAPKLSGLKRRALVDKMMTQPKEELERVVRVSHESMLASTGITCFADDPRNILSWAHYGGSHRGICLQFEVLKDLRVFGRAVPMEYGDEYPEQNWLANDADSQSRVLYGKYSAWAYERERRVIAPGGAHKWLHFEPATLTGLIVGCAAREQERAEVKQLLDERNAAGLPSLRTYEAVRDLRRYELSIKKRRLP